MLWGKLHEAIEEARATGISCDLYSLQIVKVPSQHLFEIPGYGHANITDSVAINVLGGISTKVWRMQCRFVLRWR